MSNTTPRHINAPHNCTGCGLCANVCSKDAIRMEWSEAGFLILYRAAGSAELLLNK